MKPLDTALKYMDILYSGKDIEMLRNILSEELIFKGPFFEFDTAEDYINSLKSDPPIGFKYELLYTFEESSVVCLIYQFSKPGIQTPMTQLFEFREDKICKTLLIFDTSQFI